MDEILQRFRAAASGGSESRANGYLMLSNVTTAALASMALPAPRVAGGDLRHNPVYAEHYARWWRTRLFVCIVRVCVRTRRHAH